MSAARLDTLDGLRDRDYASLAGGYERRAGHSFLSSRYELRLGERDDRHLLTAAGAFRLSPAWCAFVR